MKFTKSLLALSIISAGLCFSSTSLAAVHTYTSSATTTTQAKKNTQYLFVVSAGNGGVKAGKTNGTYILDLNLSDVNQVIAFSDRPQRIVKYITGNDLKNIWSQGTNSFKVDPPNAVLSSQNISPVIVILNNVKVNGNHIIYSFTSDKQLAPNKLKHITLTIDNIGAIGTGATSKEIGDGLNSFLHSIGV